MLNKGMRLDEDLGTKLGDSSPLGELLHEQRKISSAARQTRLKSKLGDAEDEAVDALVFHKTYDSTSLEVFIPNS